MRKMNSNGLQPVTDDVIALGESYHRAWEIDQGACDAQLNAMEREYIATLPENREDVKSLLSLENFTHGLHGYRAYAGRDYNLIASILYGMVTREYLHPVDYEYFANMASYNETRRLSP